MHTAKDREPGECPQNPAATTGSLADEFENVVKPRRAAAGIEADDRGSWALALSGGGIRSATFCFGLIRGLAKNGVLREFDYLSTVSGGGYVGSSLGRLYGAPDGKGERAGAAFVEGGVASDGSMWLWWLRNNGRYLTPAGAKDLGFASASIARGIVATNLEIGVLLLLLAGVVLAPHVLVSLDPPQPSPPLAWWSLAFAQLGNSAWWWLLPLPVFAFAHQVLAYWYSREKQSPASLVVISIAAALGTVAAWLSWRNGIAEFREGLSAPETFSRGTTLAAMLASLLLLAPATAWLAAMLDWLRAKPIVAVRLKRTQRQSYAMWAMGLVAALAVLDASAWWITRFFWQGGFGRFPLGKTALAGLLLLAGRFLLPEIQKRMAAAKKPNINVEKLLNVLGLALSLAVLVFWTSTFSIFLFPQWAWIAEPAAGATPWRDIAVQHWLLVVGVCFLYALLTCHSFELLNLASLHNYYRARIERAYVSSGNSGWTGLRFPDSALVSATQARRSDVAPLMEAIEGDDIDLVKYRPHDYGGPIHLVNCCINQSIDDRTGIYNADRKGVALTVSALGAEVGTDFAAQSGFARPPGNLSRWIAISGAAASTGMGSRTSPGFGALLFMSGIRLGYWIRALAPPCGEPRSRPGWARSMFARLAPKPLAIVAESLARFPGPFGSVWYVSDGGHFDNTGIYALLKRRPRLVVAADCGADPKYLFTDLESLVRKAKIDYGASIEFIDPEHVPEESFPELRNQLGTPETISPEANPHWLVLGRIQYADGSQGTLLVVKPRRLDRMPFDVVAYADRNPDFPQQTTGDQFFDEAQWEAYHQLGLLLGWRIDRRMLADALAVIDEKPHAPSSLIAAEAAASQQETQGSRRSRAGLTVRASLGAGISLSLVLAVWQVFEKYRETRLDEQQQYDDQYHAFIDRIADPEQLRKARAEDFRAFASLSENRRDGRYEYLRTLVNDACAAIAARSGPDANPWCVDLHGKMGEEPPVHYDYWFEDRTRARTAAQEARAAAQRVRIAAAGAGPVAAPLPAPAPPLPSPPAPATDAAANLPVQQESAPPLAENIPQAAAPALPCASGNPPIRIYIHIYDEATRQPASELAYDLAEALHVKLPPIENVASTGERASKGKAAPYRWSTPALVYHRDVDPACRDAIRALMPGQKVVTRELPSFYRNNPGMVELWLPPER